MLNISSNYRAAEVTFLNYKVSLICWASVERYYGDEHWRNAYE